MSLLYATTASFALWFSLYGLIERCIRLVIFHQGNTRYILPNSIREIFFFRQSFRATTISQYVAIIHGIAVNVLAMHYLWFGMDDISRDIIRGISIGYYMYDIVIYFGKYDIYVNKTNFPTSSIYLCLSLLAFPCGTVGINLAELHSPFLHVAFTMIKGETMKKYPLMFSVSTGMALAFFVIFRVLGLGYMCYRSLYRKEYILFSMLAVLWYTNIGFVKEMKTFTPLVIFFLKHAT